jgi:hypothetical protein
MMQKKNYQMLEPQVTEEEWKAVRPKKMNATITQKMKLHCRNENQNEKTGKSIDEGMLNKLKH